jgi:hypothetical protein
MEIEIHDRPLYWISVRALWVTLSLIALIVGIGLCVHPSQSLSLGSAAIVMALVGSALYLLEEKDIRLSRRVSIVLFLGGFLTVIAYDVFAISAFFESENVVVCGCFFLGMLWTVIAVVVYAEVVTHHISGFFQDRQRPPERPPDHARA